MSAPTTTGDRSSANSSTVLPYTGVVPPRVAQPLPTALDPDLQFTLLKDKKILETTELPIVTVAGTYLEDLKGLHGLPERDTDTDIVLSRAHYSMALGVAIGAWQRTIDPKKAWIVDPTNYVNRTDWSKITITETIGKVLARHPLLKQIKDLVDRFGRQKLPILASITPPLTYLCADIKKPILSLHIATGNILAKMGKTVVQVITDPHVRSDYLANAHLPNMWFCLFDEATKHEFFEKAVSMGKYVDPRHVIVTGPPIDPRVINAGQHKKPWRANRPLRICITTGGLGTNKVEIETILNQLAPLMRRQHNTFQLMVYAGTHADIRDSVLDIAQKERLTTKLISGHDPANYTISGRIRRLLKLNRPRAELTVLYHPQIVDANELLITHGFPWADGFISKPSGDMAYDVAAAGSFLLTLQEWGEWEHNVRSRFELLGIARKADTMHIIDQLRDITKIKRHELPWVYRAQQAAKELPDLYLQGAKNIVATVLGLQKSHASK